MTLHLAAFPAVQPRDHERAPIVAFVAMLVACGFGSGDAFGDYAASDATFRAAQSAGSVAGFLGGLAMEGGR